MSHADRDHKYTIGLADKAMEFIRALKLPGDPPSFEVWYTYAGRFIPSLNSAINDAIADAVAKGQALSAGDVDNIYDRHFGAFRFGKELETIKGNVGAALDEAGTIIETAIGSAARYEDCLSHTQERLSGPREREPLSEVVDGLLEATRTATHESHRYKIELENARAEISDLRAHVEALKVESLIDPLTTLLNRRQFDRSLGDHVFQAAKTLSSLTLAMCDVDDFKAINDSWGHPMGDDVLRLIAQAIRENTRELDIAGRYGGDEFAMILPGTDRLVGEQIAQRICTAVSERELIQRSTGHSLGRVTVSIGVAQWKPNEATRELIERADACLYTAKRQGRNRVVGYKDVHEAERSKVA
jgi:diguanylate cyclase